MIVREVLYDPSQPFDYYNDYKDTLNFLRWYAVYGFNGSERGHACKAIEVLEKGHSDYVAGLHYRD